MYSTKHGSLRQLGQYFYQMTFSQARKLPRCVFLFCVPPGAVREQTRIVLLNLLVGCQGDPGVVTAAINDKSLTHTRPEGS